MTFRTRLLVAFLATVLIPMVALAFFIRGEMTDRLTGQYERRVAALVDVIETDLSARGELIGRALTAITDGMLNDNRFRRGTVDADAQERRYVLDYAREAMRLAGLDMLQVQDGDGRILSSGHFRNEFDRLEPALPRLLAKAPGRTALVETRAPDQPFIAIARSSVFTMGGRRFTLVGGIEAGESFLAGLAREENLRVTLVYSGKKDEDAAAPGPARDANDAIVRELTVPFIGAARDSVATARFRVAHDLGELHALRRSIDRWFLIAVLIAAALSIAVVAALAARISRPLESLAEKTANVDLDRLDVGFDTGGRDEIGTLSRVLAAMTERIRTSAAHVKDAERRATLGEMARQVNHDIKNGLTPIRNVFRHLSELAVREPDRLPAVFAQRRRTMDSSISYLEELAANYARLSSRGERRVCDLNEVIRSVVSESRGGDGVQLESHLSEGAVVRGDPVSLRRIVGNLVANAIDSLAGGRGRVTVSTERRDDGGEGAWIRVTVADTGAGMTPEERVKAFDDFYTTKDDGTGLGLSIVRRLVMDMDGSIRVESERGTGSRFCIDLPAAEGN